MLCSSACVHGGLVLLLSPLPLVPRVLQLLRRGGTGTSAAVVSWGGTDPLG